MLIYAATELYCTHCTLAAATKLEVALKERRFDFQHKESVSDTAESNRKMFISTVALTR